MKPSNKLHRAATVPCPACGSHQTSTKDVRASDGNVRRRKLCVCGHRFTTYESLSSRYVMHNPDYQI